MLLESKMFLMINHLHAYLLAPLAYLGKSGAGVVGLGC